MVDELLLSPSGGHRLGEQDAAEPNSGWEQRFVRAGISLAGRGRRFEAPPCASSRHRCRSSDRAQCMRWFGIDKSACESSEHDDWVVNAAEQTSYHAPVHDPHHRSTDDAHDRGADDDRPADDAHDRPAHDRSADDADDRGTDDERPADDRGTDDDRPDDDADEHRICPDDNCNGDPVELLPFIDSLGLDRARDPSRGWPRRRLGPCAPFAVPTSGLDCMAAERQAGVGAGSGRPKAPQRG